MGMKRLLMQFMSHFWFSKGKTALLSLPKSALIQDLQRCLRWLSSQQKFCTAAFLLTDGGFIATLLPYPLQKPQADLPKHPVADDVVVKKWWHRLHVDSCFFLGTQQVSISLKTSQIFQNQRCCILSRKPERSFSPLINTDSYLIRKPNCKTKSIFWQSKDNALKLYNNWILKITE